MKPPTQTWRSPRICIACQHPSLIPAAFGYQSASGHFSTNRKPCKICPFSEWNRVEPSAIFFIRRDELLLLLIGRVPICESHIGLAIPIQTFVDFYLRKRLSINGPQTSTNRNKHENVCTLQGLKVRHVIALTSIIDPAGPGTTKELFLPVCRTGTNRLKKI